MGRAATQAAGPRRALGDGIWLLSGARPGLPPVDQLVLLREIAERAEAHPQELGRARLHTLGPIERHLHELLTQPLELALEIDSLLAQVGGQLARGAACASEVVRQLRRPD